MPDTALSLLFMSTNGIDICFIYAVDVFHFFLYLLTFMHDVYI